MFTKNEELFVMHKWNKNGYVFWHPIEEFNRDKLLNRCRVKDYFEKIFFLRFECRRFVYITNKYGLNGRNLLNEDGSPCFR